MKMLPHIRCIKRAGKVVTLSLILFLPSWAGANCIQNAPVDAPFLYYDATSALNLSGRASFSSTTAYPGTFSCSMPAWGIIGGKNTVDNSTPYSQNTLYLKFPGDAYVSVNVTQPTPQEFHPKVGTNNGSAIDSTFTVNLKLLANIPTKNVMVINGDIATINPIVLAQDSTGLTFLQNIARMLSDFAYFIFHWSWPKHNYDIYYKALQIRFVKRVTTCSFDDDNKTVVLNNIDIASLASGAMNGKKAFTLNFSCDGMKNGIAGRNLRAFMSSNNLLASDSTTLTSPVTGGAKGVGIRVAKASDNIPLTFSSSETTQGNATTLFSYTASQALPSQLSLPMNAWYYVYNKQMLSSGSVRTTAVVNFVYD
ncbi:fimbrial protein [Erwinia rhapontici]|nr:type 1 fimbria pilin [Erwinia rhapontici]